MEEKGWIKLFSKFINWEWYKDQNTKDLFIHCLLKANWKDGNFEGEVIPKGSFVTSLDTLSKELGLSVQAIRTSLKHLISTKELTSKSTNKYRIITVLNYELYQQANKQTNIQLTSNQQATNKQLTTIEDIYSNNYYLEEEYNAHARVYEKYSNNIGQITEILKEELDNWINEIQNDELIIYAIRLAVLNNTRKMSYISGILRNWQKENIKTIEDLKQEKHEERIVVFDYDWLENGD